MTRDDDVTRGAERFATGPAATKCVRRACSVRLAAALCPLPVGLACNGRGVPRPNCAHARAPHQGVNPLHKNCIFLQPSSKQACARRVWNMPNLWWWTRSRAHRRCAIRLKVARLLPQPTSGLQAPVLRPFSVGISSRCRPPAALPLRRATNE